MFLSYIFFRSSTDQRQNGTIQLFVGLVFIALIVGLFVIFYTHLLSNIQTQAAGPTAQSAIVIGNASLCPSPDTRNIVNSIWYNDRKQYMIDNMNSLLKTGSATPNPVILYEVQLYTQNLLEMSANCHDDTLLDSLAQVYLTAYPYLNYSSGSAEWVDYNGNEGILNSSQYLYALARTTSIIASLPASERTAAMNDFLAKYVPVITSHYNRWIYLMKIFYNLSGDCSKTLYDHYDYLHQLMNRTDTTALSYCNAVNDVDAWIIAGTTELLGANTIDPVNVPLDPTLQNQLVAYVQYADTLLKSRVNQTSLTNLQNQPVTGEDFDEGAWRDHATDGYAGYTGLTFPTASDSAKVANIGWDISHGARLVMVFNTMYRYANTFSFTFPTTTDMNGFANQIIYKTFNKDQQWPRFANFMDGSNGWYEVNYSGPGFGYAPYFLSRAFPIGGYGYWAQFNPDIATIDERIKNIMLTTDATTIQFRDQNYKQHYYYQYIVTTDPDSFNTTDSMTLLMTLPALAENGLAPTTTPTPSPSPTPTPTPTPTQTPVPAQTMTFDTYKANSVLSGQYPAGLINWGSGVWFVGRPTGKFTTNNLQFNNNVKDGSFAFLSPRKVISLDVYNVGGSSNATMTLSCSGQTAASLTVAPNVVKTLVTHWSKACSPVTMTTSNGWNTIFDNLVISLL